MTTTAQTWESTLLALATPTEHEDIRHEHNHDPSPHLLLSAYSQCESMTQEHSRSFFMASQLLPREKRLAARALYAFCRTTDDIVDNPNLDTHTTLNQWRKRALAWNPVAHDPIALAWADARLRFSIPRHYAQQLIDGVARDLHQDRYETFEELATYCYGVASTVGLMSMHIIGFNSEAALPYAIKLGVALQLTNILRDIGEDWERGRLYLPLEELYFFDLTEDDVAYGRMSDRWRTFMRFQIARTRQIYAEAWPGIAMLHRDGRLAIAAAASFYRAILDDIEENDYDTFNRRAYISQWGKVRQLPHLWWQTRGRH